MNTFWSIIRAVIKSTVSYNPEYKFDIIMIDFPKKKKPGIRPKAQNISESAIFHCPLSHTPLGFKKHFHRHPDTHYTHTQKVPNHLKSYRRICPLTFCFEGSFLSVYMNAGLVLIRWINIKVSPKGRLADR